MTMLTYILLLGLLWLAEIAWLSLELEMALRVLAAGALVLHPWHEQRLGFLWRFNLAVTPQYQKPFHVRDVDKNVPPRGWPDRWPLSRRQNALQAAGLITVFPALALWGPWWAIVGLAAFYVGDLWYTHDKKGVPAKWSAGVGHVATLALLLVVDGPTIIPFHWLHLLQGLGSAASGLLLLALPWWMAYRRVRS